MHQQAYQIKEAKLAGYVACMEEMRNAYNIIIEKQKGK
jgi:hypothetical protein